MRSLRFIFAMAYMFSTPVCSNAQTYTVANFRIPGGLGTISASPAPTSGSIGGAWDGQISVGPNAPASGVLTPPAKGGSSSQKGNSVPPKSNAAKAPVQQPGAQVSLGPAPGSAAPKSTAHGDHRGFMMWADMQGFAALDARVAAKEQHKQYLAWAAQASTRMKKFLNDQPKIARDLVDVQLVAGESVLESDSEDAKALAQTGEALVMMEFQDNNDVKKILNSLGVDAGNGGYNQSYVLLDLVSRYHGEEWHQRNELIDFGRRSTRQMRDHAVKNSERTAQASQDMGVVLGEFGAVSARNETSGSPAAVNDLSNKIANIETYSP